MARDRLHVAVSGGGEAGEVACRLAEEVGRELARRGAVVVTGGLGGAMEAACRGAKAGGGTTLGILPTHDRADANEWVDVAVPTGLGDAIASHEAWVAADEATRREREHEAFSTWKRT